MNATHRFMEMNGLRFEVFEFGAPSTPLVVLLHGFPDHWKAWEHQISPMICAGYRVLVPHQRGYGDSDKPSGIASYDIDLLASDVVALARSLGYERFDVIGHDWGGLVAWWTAALYPGQVRSCVTINAPHPGVYKRFALRHPTQLLKSWYVFAFQIPWVPEWFLRRNRFAALHRAIDGTSPPGTFDQEDHRLLEAAWAVPGALSAMVNYYRAIVRCTHANLSRRIEPPALIVWGTADPVLDERLAEASAWMCENCQIQRCPQAMHNPQRETAAEVNRRLVNFLTGVIEQERPIPASNASSSVSATSEFTTADRSQNGQEA
jgi:pimeloyl-ACP methyl ester carboxylesterase